jgi:hypothetical protein
MLLLLHAAATCYMCGVIWFVQLVHYPLFASVERGHFIAYQREHVRRTGWVVGPAMLAEGASALALCLLAPDGLSPLAVWGGLALLAVIWLSTFFWQVPSHNALLNGFDAERHAWLVRSNWVRTVLWSARAVLALAHLPS